MQASISGSLRGIFKDLISWRSPHVIEEPAEFPRFRGSGIPHCPIHVAIESISDTQRIDARGFMLDFVSEQGKVAHALLQKWLGVVGVMYGKWSCSKCGAVYPKPEDGVPGIKGPVACCNTPCEYVEYDIAVPEIGFTGHCDGLLMLRGKLLPIEAKVRGTAVVEKIKKTGPYSIDNITQATSYRWTLPKQLGLSADAFHDYVGLLYFDRADIRNFAVLAHPYRREVFENEIRARRRTERIVELRIFNRLRGHGFCKHKDDRPFCPYHDTCFSRDPDAALARLLPGYNKPIKPEDIPEHARKQIRNQAAALTHEEAP